MALKLKLCFLGLVAMAYFGVVAAQADCHLGVAKCFDDAGLDFTNPEFSIFSKAISDYPNTLSYVKEMLEIQCGKKDQAKKIITCVMGQVIRCASPQFQPYIPTDNALREAIDYLCDNRKVITSSRHFECMEGQFQIMRENVDQCVDEEVTKTGVPPVFQDMTCPAFKVFPVCLKKYFEKCGCATTKMILDIYDIVYPKPCPASNAPQVFCNKTNPDAFVDGGANGVHSFWLWNILISILFFFTSAHLY